MDNHLTSNSYWESLSRTSVGDDYVIFSEIFKKFLVKENNQDRNILEIGCVPGLYLAYIAKTFGYFPEGIDYIKGGTEVTKKTLKNFGLYKSVIYEHDFTDWETDKRYDLVCSFGFVEHFYETDKIILKHLDLLKIGGKLIIEFPNFNYGQKIMHNFLDKNNFERHNVEIMNLNFFKNIVSQYNLEINYLGYYGGLFDFWWENEKPSYFQNFIKFILKCVAFIAKRIPINNKLFSPYMMLIATKK